MPAISWTYRAAEYGITVDPIFAANFCKHYRRHRDDCKFSRFTFLKLRHIVQKLVRLRSEVFCIDRATFRINKELSINFMIVNFTASVFGFVFCSSDCQVCSPSVAVAWQ